MSEKCEEHCNVAEKANTAHRELYGNGDSNKGLVTRVTRAEEHISGLGKIMKQNNRFTLSTLMLLVGLAIKIFFF